jgi:hypothetical protein
MAVVQISKIQHRRGRKNSGSSLPQLASGELGWAIDTQELYIGNGSVSEGAPYVGNTKVITEHDNILDLALQYQYKRNDPSTQTGPTASQPFQRTIQERLDDTVSVKSFGAQGNGVADDTHAIQRAIDQLYINVATVESVSSRTGLTFEAGVYKITGPLRIPPYATLIGAGKEKTIIRQTGQFPVAYTINSASTPGNYKDFTDLTFNNQAQQIRLEGMTLEQTIAGYPVLDLIAVKHSLLKNLRFKGVWLYPAGRSFSINSIVSVGSAKVLSSPNNHGLVVGDEIFPSISSNGLIAHQTYYVTSVPNSTTFTLAATPEGLDIITFVDGTGLGISCERLSVNEVGLRLIALSASVTCSSNLIYDCDFYNLSYAVDSTYDIDSNVFSNCNFRDLSRAVRFGHNVNGTTTGRLYGPNQNKITDSKFERIKETAVDVYTGTGNTSQNNKYIEVGNDGGNEGNPIFNVIKFRQPGNVSIDDYFDRSIQLTSNLEFIVGVPYKGEVGGFIKSEHKYNQKINLQPGINPLLKLPADDSLSHVIHYFYKSNILSVTRQGKIFINVDRTNNQIHLTDDCSVIGNATNLEKLIFLAELGDADNDAVNETVVVRYNNNVASDDGYINYWYETLS